MTFNERYISMNLLQIKWSSQEIFQFIPLDKCLSKWRFCMENSLQKSIYTYKYLELLLTWRRTLDKKSFYNGFKRKWAFIMFSETINYTYFIFIGIESNFYKSKRHHSWPMKSDKYEMKNWTLFFVEFKLPCHHKILIFRLLIRCLFNSTANWLAYFSFWPLLCGQKLAEKRK